MNLLLIVLLGIAQQTADTSLKGHAALGSLHVAHDTTALVRALRSWKGPADARIELYRGVSAAWTGRATEAVGILRPLLDSASVRLTRRETRDDIGRRAERYTP